VISFFYVIIPLPHVYHIYYTRTVYLYKNSLYTTAQTLTIQEVIRSQKFWSK